MDILEISPVSTQEVPRVVEHLFRHEAGKIVATLTGIFGVEHLGLAEDVVQEALARALRTWPFHGVPQNPAAWIMRTARNLALDTVRREKVFRGKEAEITRLVEQNHDVDGSPNVGNEEIADDTLRMMFVCCHPGVPADAQAALALKTLCGFSPAEIASAFLTTEAAIAKRLTRAKQKIRALNIRFEIPEGRKLARRLDGVLRALYLLFNEGYKASRGGRLVREDLCHESIRLAGLVVRHPAGDRPEAHALLALMLLNAARLPARVDDDGHLLRLREQDRAVWSRPMIARGMFHLARSAAGGAVTDYHLQAGIAACHCSAADYASTDWRRILELYDRLLEIDRSPVVALNRAVALAEVHGPTAGLNAVRAISDLRALESYHLLHAVQGELEARLGHWEAAARHFQRSAQLAEIESEKRFLEKRLAACHARASKYFYNSVPSGSAHSSIP